MSESKLQFIFTEDSFVVDNPNAEILEAEKKLRDSFLDGRYNALYQIGFDEGDKAESPSLSFLREFSSKFYAALTDLPEIELLREKAKVRLSDDTTEGILRSVPFGPGTENVNREWIEKNLERLNGIFAAEIQNYKGTVQLYLTEKSQSLRVPERIFFHLVESKEEAHPFAFVATYATCDKSGLVRHLPLSYALTEFKNRRGPLVAMLSCLNKVAEISPLISGFMESGELFHPLYMSSSEAYEFLKQVPQIEEKGILCRVPNWWKKQYASVSMELTLGGKKASFLGFDTIVSVVPTLSVGGVPLTKTDILNLLKQTEGLAYLKGRWVEVNHARLKCLLEDMESQRSEMTLLEALRAQTGMNGSISPDVGVKVTNGKWLNDMLTALRKPVTLSKEKVPENIHATLRPYQETGFNWLLYMQKLGFGACLADDMGLGKTLQIITLLEKMRTKSKRTRVLLVVPASLLGNWKNELEKFAPGLDYNILHGRPQAELEKEIKANRHFLNITTYGMAVRMESLQKIIWDSLILDEAQAIKNPLTKQTRTLKKIQARHKIAMTGTPIENDLTNLWSLFDFLNKGILGTSNEFKEFSNNLETDREGYQKLRNMLTPFILRRVKTDKSIISDLPEKLEQVEHVGLSKKQVVLYKKQVDDLAFAIENSDGMKRRGLILSAITKLKQICNHPDQYLGQNTFDPKESGKFQMLRDICETIYEKRERVLIFTQYKEITDKLSKYLETIFHGKGLVLHGGVKPAQRTEMVKEFNSENYVPYMVLSVKAGGTGLNLTAANHVIHFDRWWNPAVENQATDRAFRIGQKKNVVVHKFVSEKTIEEKIDAMIESKKELAANVIGSGGENWITEMSNAEILSLMRLEA